MVYNNASTLLQLAREHAKLSDAGPGVFQVGLAPLQRYHIWDEQDKKQRSCELLVYGIYRGTGLNPHTSTIHLCASWVHRVG